MHALAHPLGAHYNLHHGLTNAVLLPYVMLANREVIEARMPLLGRVLNLVKADFGGVLEWVLLLRRRLAIPHSLGALGVDEGMAQVIAAQATRDPCAATNPRPLSAEDYAAILMRAIRGELSV